MRYVTLYNDKSGRYVSSASAGDGRALDVEELYRCLENQPYACFLRLIGSNYNTEPTKTAKVYTFVFPVKLKPDGSTDLVVIDAAILTRPSSLSAPPMWNSALCCRTAWAAWWRK